MIHEELMEVEIILNQLNESFAIQLDEYREFLACSYSLINSNTFLRQELIDLLHLYLAFSPDYHLRSSFDVLIDDFFLFSGNVTGEDMIKMCRGGTKHTTKGIHVRNLLFGIHETSYMPNNISSRFLRLQNVSVPIRNMARKMHQFVTDVQCITLELDTNMRKRERIEKEVRGDDHECQFFMSPPVPSSPQT
jgi:hypothetical protein